MNWIEEWKRRQDRAILYQDAANDGEESYWSENARSYDRKRTADGALEHDIDVICGLLEPDMTVLEIGAGTGALTLPLSCKVKHITAVEPSPSMAEVLKEKLSHNNVRNVELVPSKWQDADVEACDVVIASGCLYVFYDIEVALRKMLEKAKRKLILVSGDWGYWSPYHEAADFLGLPQVTVAPGYVCLYNVMVELGLHSSMAVNKIERCLTYDSIQQMTESWVKRLKVPQEKRRQLDEYLKEKAVILPSGEVSMGQTETISAVIWFDKDFLKCDSPGALSAV